MVIGAVVVTTGDVVLSGAVVTAGSTVVTAGSAVVDAAVVLLKITVKPSIPFRISMPSQAESESTRTRRIDKAKHTRKRVFILFSPYNDKFRISYIQTNYIHHHYTTTSKKIKPFPLFFLLLFLLHFR